MFFPCQLTDKLSRSDNPVLSMCIKLSMKLDNQQKLWLNQCLWTIAALLRHTGISVIGFDNPHEHKELMIFGILPNGSIPTNNQ